MSLSLSLLSTLPLCHLSTSFFFFNDTATTEIYTLSLHDALPISAREIPAQSHAHQAADGGHHRGNRENEEWGDRKSTRLNSSHGYISYAVFCLKKKKTNTALLTVDAQSRGPHGDY